MGQETKRVGLQSGRLAESLGKLPPQAVDLEEAVLGAIMLEKNSLIEVVDMLSPETFYKDAHVEIYKAIIDLFNASLPIDMKTVNNKLRENGTLEFAGGAYYIAELTSKVSSAANIEYHSRIISEMAMKRDLITIASQIQQDAYEDTQDVFQLLEFVEMQLGGIVEKNVKGSFMKLSHSLNDTVKKVTNMKDMDVTGVPSGLHELDKITGGWQKSDLSIVAARPGMGKTAFIVSCMLNAAKKGYKVGMFSLEMSRFQLDQRIISAEARVPLAKVRKPKDMTPEELKSVKEVTAKVGNYGIFIDDSPSLNVVEMKAKSRRLYNNEGLDMVIVDYLQLMKGEGKGNREQEISSISRALKEIAKELDIPVIALSQLSRAVESRGGQKKPMLSDLRESGSIEQDADLVMFLYRPEYYQIFQDSKGQPLHGKGMAIIAKNRQGALDEAYMKFIGSLTKWENENEIHNTLF